MRSLVWEKQSAKLGLEMLRLLSRCTSHSQKQIRRRFSSTASLRLEGKVALITGGASGLGKATAHAFIQQGAHVVIADINTQLGPQASRDLGPQAHFVPCDVAVEAHISDAVDLAVARHGKLDVMCNIAGIVGSAFPPSIVDLELHEFDRVMAVNVRGTMAGIKHAARVMVPAGSGSILCTASISGLLGGCGPHPYTVSKFAIPGMVKSLASELCGHGVRINCISPSPIPTPLVVEQLRKIMPSATRDEIVGMIKGLGELKGAICEEEDVARAALYLASDDAKFVTGHNLVVDGGFTTFKNLNFPKLT
ncbi:zerumbone synthase-like [Salvia miltiorrhiza]|uniref:zerumbone synthase-like n=1 Tax=Salvia miltiorrhiza TaxID=226208 RepID=UPI0025ABF23D|nr:zerumbone synthase-like [Salvia miltiorrhiza]